MREKSTEGIVVATDLYQEWLLSWWWDNYICFNAFPVTFIDFGMTKEAREWCRERGELIPLLALDLYVKDKSELSPFFVEGMEIAHGKKIWASREAWFKKPFACLQTPYERSLWIDLDCQICGSLQPLFAYCEHPSGIALIQENEKMYNSGVIVFKRDAPLLKSWGEQTLKRNDEFAGDQDIISAIICEEGLEISKLPLLYNWSRFNPENSQALILHWHGPHGKTVISHQIMRANLESLGLLPK